MNRLTSEQLAWLRAEVSRRRLAQLADESDAKRPPAVRRAIAWLEEFLSHGPRLGADVRGAAARADVSPDSLRSARRALGVITTNGGRSGSMWRLP